MMTSDKLSSRKPPADQSPGLLFLLAAKAAMPRTLGKAVRVAAMGEVLRLAIGCRMAFGRGEGAGLRRLDLQTCAGVFRTLDEHWYTQACRVGGTYAAMWEAHHGHKPWIAPDVLVGRDSRDQARDNRVAPNMALLLPSSGDDDPDLPRYGSASEVWWCTSLDRTADTITLCRYRLLPGKRWPTIREGQPRRRCVLDRAGWAELFRNTSTQPAEAAETGIAA